MSEGRIEESENHTAGGIVTTDGEEKRRSPIACNLSADEAATWNAEMSGLLTDVEEVHELDDGYAFRYEGADGREARLRMLAAFVEGERRCCPFFHFEIVLEAEGGPLWLRLRGRSGVKEYIASELVEAYGLPRA